MHACFGSLTLTNLAGYGRGGVAGRVMLCDPLPSDPTGRDRDGDGRAGGISRTQPGGPRG